MFVKFISVVMSVVMTVSSFVFSSVSNIADAISEMLFGIPYTQEAIDSDFFSDIDASDIVLIDENSGFIRDKIIVFIDSQAEFSDKIDFFANCGGILAGWCTPSDIYVISYPAMSYEQVLSKCQKLSENEIVELSIPVMTFKNETNATPNDVFDTSEELVWDEIKPGGSNWHLEAIDARQAWDYSKYFSNINIGIVDAGFETEHPDLSGKINFPDSKQEKRNVATSHGSHVAGIIGANQNNAVGISGICNNSKLICIDWQPDFLQLWSTDIAIFFGFSTLVKAGAKVVNFSLGTSGSKTDNNSSFMERVIVTAATSYMMASLLSKGYDFIAVQSAGNGDMFGDPIDAINNGRFCALTEDNIFTGSKKVPSSEILDRIIVVGSADNNGDGTYRQSEFSNVGSQVSIAAPGGNIYSCSLDNGYEYMSGTSMAAPIVTGVASLVWSVNPSFTGADVKDIVCSSTDSVASINNDAFYYYDVELADYPMVNAKLAVEEAIRRTHSSVGTVSGKITGDNAETISFNGVSHTLFSDGTYSFVADAGSAAAEIYDKDGNLLGSFDLTVTAGETTLAEEFIIGNMAEA